MNQKKVTAPKEAEDIIKKAVKDKKPSILMLLNREGDVRFEALKLDIKDD